jgi:hypothetical protein
MTPDAPLDPPPWMICGGDCGKCGVECWMRKEEEDGGEAVPDEEAG